VDWRVCARARDDVIAQRQGNSTVDLPKGGPGRYGSALGD
jgi:hypothetical protein